jgi:hypothetical protein
MTATEAGVSRWRVKAVLRVPQRLRGVEPTSPGGPPSRLEQDRQFEPGTEVLEGERRIELRSADKPTAAQYELAEAEAAELVVEARGQSAYDALDESAPLFARIINELAFEVDEPIAVLGVEVSALTDEGGKRTLFVGSPFDRYAQGLAAMTDEIYSPTRHARLRTYRPLPPQVETALRFYVRAMSTSMLPDQFTFLWIALETLAAKSDIRIREPTRLRCGHVVESCPVCGVGRPRTTDSAKASGST